MRTQLRILHQRYQRLYLLWDETLELFHDVCVVIQLQESRVELHLLRERKSIDIAVSDIAVYRVFHTLDKPADTLPLVDRSQSICHIESLAGILNQ